MFKISTENREMIIQGEMADVLFDACVGFVQDEYRKLSLGGVQTKKVSIAEDKPKRKGGRPKKVKVEPVQEPVKTEKEDSP